MDVFFHAVSGAFLARTVGERRPRQLMLAGLIGMLPDLTMTALRLTTHIDHPWQITHNILTVIAVCLILCLYNWRIALALPLHVLVDLPIHKNSVLYQQWLHVEGINWWQGAGIWIAISLWAILLTLIILSRRRQTKVVANK
jgi:hypothetical protein